MKRADNIRPLHARTEALLRRLVRRDAEAAIRKVLATTRPEDIAAAMEHLTWAEQRRLYRVIEDQGYAADVLGFLSDQSAVEVTRSMTEDQVVDLVNRMEPDDATDLVGLLPDALRDRVLEGLEGESAVHDLLRWPDDSAGGRMSPMVFRMPDTATCGQAIATLQQQHSELATSHYVYIVDHQQGLVGVTSLRSLLTSPPGTPLVRIMTREIITVAPTQDQEEVARFVARYDLLAIPVVDEARRILGVVTVDDVVDVIRSEAAEDMLLMAGVSEASDHGGILQHGWRRAGWLLATIAGGVFASEIIVSYESTLEEAAVLAGFIPVIMGIGGNVGIQSATVAVRGLTSGAIQIQGALPFVWREARIGVVLGLFFALMLGLYGYVRYTASDEAFIGPAVACSSLLAIAFASVIGSSLPIVFRRLNVDPAIATGPFVTTLVDILGIAIYFNVARWLIHS